MHLLEEAARFQTTRRLPTNALAVTEEADGLGLGVRFPAPSMGARERRHGMVTYAPHARSWC